MNKNSQYMRSVNDYSLSAHELFCGLTFDAHPKETRVFVIKHIPDTDTIESVKSEIKDIVRKNTESLSVEKTYHISYRDALVIDDDAYTIYGQDFLTRGANNRPTNINGMVWSVEGVVVEMYRRAEELIVIALANVDLSWLTTTYEEIQGRYPEPVEDLSNTFFAIGRSASGSFELQSVELQTVYDETIVDTHYNDSFRPTWDLTVDSIDNNANGLILLHGDAGAGKSSILKQLIARGGSRKIVYIPSYLATSLSDPSFIGFVRKNMINAVLVIEDGEDVLKSREEHTSPAVTNILQISDGILGDALNMLIIATFNTALANIDGALQRRGRMIAEYKFGELEIGKAEALVEKLFGEDHNLTLPKQLTLANLFTLDKHQPKTVVAEPRKIGFN